MAETLAERIVRLKRELTEARAEKRRLGIASDLMQDPGLVIKPRAKPGPKPKPRPSVVPSGTVKRTATARWQFRVKWGRGLVLGPERLTSSEAADDLAQWRRSQIEQGSSATSKWSEPDESGRQTCLVCEGEGEVNQSGAPCLACNGDGYRWV